MTLPIDLSKAPTRSVGPVCFYTTPQVDAKITEMEESSGLSRSELIHRIVIAALFPEEGTKPARRSSDRVA